MTPACSANNTVNTLQDIVLEHRLPIGLGLLYGCHKASEIHVGGAGWGPFNMRNVIAAGIVTGVGYCVNTQTNYDNSVSTLAATICGICIKLTLDNVYRTQTIHEEYHHDESSTWNKIESKTTYRPFFSFLHK